MRIVLVLVFLTTFTANGYSQELAYQIADGYVYVGGSKASRQVFIAQNDSTYRLSNYANWENIDELFVSPDKNYLIVYHRADKERFYRITLYDLQERIAVATTAPGMACHDLKWFADKILFISGWTGLGTFVFVYNYNLVKLFNMRGDRLFIDAENAICFSYPVNGFQDGIFTEYDLGTGAAIGDFDFGEEANDNYVCRSVSFVGNRTYQFDLWTLETHKTITVKKSFD